MARMIRLFLLVEAASFVAASLVHAGVLVAGHEHARASVAEGVIATVLLAGLASIRVRPEWTRAVGAGAQLFALLGTLVGLFTIAIGIGPRTAPDLAFHATILVVLAWGLAVTAPSLARLRVPAWVWLAIAGVLTLVNVVGVWEAAQAGEPGHATLHAALGAACALWAGLIRARDRSRDGAPTAHVTSRAAR